MTFEITNGHRTLTVKDYHGDVLLHIEGEGAARGFRLPTETAPALALAMLEAAALERHVIVSAEMADALQSLRDEVKRIDERTAAVRELAELEAEAKKFYDAFNLAADRPWQDWDCLNQEDKQQWLAVAHKAREMRSAE